MSRKSSVRTISASNEWGWLSPKEARKAERRGLAHYRDDGVLVFVSTASARRDLPAAPIGPRSLVLTDGDGFASLDNIVGLPVIHPVKLITGHRPAQQPRHIPIVEVSRRYLPLVSF